MIENLKVEKETAVNNIPQVPLPESDPVYGKTGPLKDYWQR